MNQNEQHPNIEELLNAYIDGELSERRFTEVKRLIGHDPQIKQMFTQLQKTKNLLASLPRAKAPDGMFQAIHENLEREVLLEEYTPQNRHRHEGEKHLLRRWVLTTAAMILLFVTLAAIIFSIVKPVGRGESAITIAELAQPKKIADEAVAPDIITQAQKPGQDQPAVAANTADIRQLLPGVTVTAGLLELRTKNSIAANAFLSRAIYDKRLLECTNIRRQTNQSTYLLDCPREKIAQLLGDLNSIWDKFNQCSMAITTDTTGYQIKIQDVTAKQAITLLNQTKLNNRMQTARDFAVLNSLEKEMPGRELDLALQQDSSFNFGKPVLTSGQQNVSSAQDESVSTDKIKLTIIVRGF